MKDRDNQDDPFLYPEDDAIIADAEFAMAFERSAQGNPKNVGCGDKFSFNCIFDLQTPRSIKRRYVIMDYERMVFDYINHFHARA